MPGSGEVFTTPPSYGAGNYFGFDLGYDRNGVVGSYVPQYNGNIGGMAWKSAHDGQVRKYDFAYDAVNRLTGADFNQYTGNGFNKAFRLCWCLQNSKNVAWAPPTPLLCVFTNNLHTQNWRVPLGFAAVGDSSTSSLHLTAA